MNADVLDSIYLQSLPGFLRSLYKFFPVSVARALEAYRNRNRYDVVISWDDRFALIYAFLLAFTQSRSRHVAILSWMAPPSKARLLKMAQRGMDRIIVWSQCHRELLTEFWGIPSDKIVEIPYFVDQQFWHPMNSTTTEEYICSAGDSKRDYATLIEAMRALPIRCSIATQVKPMHHGLGDWDKTGKALAQVVDLPGNVVLAPASPAELRTLYARSRFVVLPLFRGFRDHGITTLAEAMAMGKAVICTRTYGQIEFLDDGENGVLVPPEDPAALQAAIQYLWEHPDLAKRMGAKGRQRAEEIFTLDRFVTNVRQVAEDVVMGTHTHIPTASEQLSGAGQMPISEESKNAYDFYAAASTQSS